MQPREPLPCIVCGQPMQPNPDGTLTCPECGTEAAFTTPDELPDDLTDPYADAAQVFFEELRAKEQIRHRGGGNRRRSGRFRGGKRVTWRRPMLATWDDDEAKPRRSRRRKAA